MPHPLPFVSQCIYTGVRYTVLQKRGLLTHTRYAGGLKSLDRLVRKIGRNKYKAKESKYELRTNHRKNYRG